MGLTKQGMSVEFMGNKPVTRKIVRPLAIKGLHGVQERVANK